MNKGAFVVTGGSRGLGKAVALAAHRLGHPVALLARSSKDLLAAAREIEKANPPGPEITGHKCDLTREKDVADAFKHIFNEHKTVRCLVNNAATWNGVDETVLKATAAKLREALELNFFSAVHATTVLLNRRRDPGKNPLSIVNIGATASLDAWPEVLPFSISKGALRGYSRALARELGPKGVHVAHVIIDGMLDNPRTEKLNPKATKDNFIRLDSLAHSIVTVALQEKSCWTMEWDVRPFKESW